MLLLYSFIFTCYPQHEMCCVAEWNLLVSSVCSSFTHMCKNVTQLLTLPLGTDVRAEATFQEFQGALILRHLEQLHGTTLVGSMSGHFTHQLADEFRVFCLDLKKSEQVICLHFLVRNLCNFV